MPSPADSTAQLARIAELLEAGKLSRAESACRTFLASSPNDSAATHLLGMIRARSGDAAGGERLLRRSVELAPLDAGLRVNLANHLRRSGRLPEAEAEYRNVLQLTPTERSARHSLALTLSDLGGHIAAEAECRRLLSGNERDAQAWCLLGVILDRQHRLADSEAAYRRALQIDAGYGLAYHNLGSVLERMDRAEEALAALERTEALGVRGFEVAFSRGKALLLLNRIAEAERAFAEAVTLRPRHPVTMRLTARAIPGRAAGPMASRHRGLRPGPAIWPCIAWKRASVRAMSFVASASMSAVAKRWGCWAPTGPARPRFFT